MLRLWALLSALGLMLVPAMATGQSEPRVPSVEEVAPGDYLLDPPGQDAPPLRPLRLRTQLYTDFTVGSSPDLSALSVVKGGARNYRFALGGTLRLRHWELGMEVPFLQVTPAHFDEFTVFGARMPLMNAKDTSVAFGDVRVGGAYVRALPSRPNLVVGGALWARLSTHNSKFEIPVSGNLVTYEFPRYWHVEPSVLFGAAWGPLSVTVNQGVLAMLGKDVPYTLDTGGGPLMVTQVFPELYFWDAHYGLGLYFLGAFGFTLELNTVIQLNTVENPPFPSPPYADQLNDITAVYLSPALQLYAGAYKVDIAGRIGLSDGADRLGVITFAGRYSAMLRLTRTFDYGSTAARP